MDTIEEALAAVNLGLHAHHIYDGADLRETKPQGRAYDYILAGNGLFLHAANEHMTAVLPLAGRMVRNLPRLEPFVHLQRKMSRNLLTLLWAHARQHFNREVYYHIHHDPETAILRQEIVAYGSAVEVEAVDHAGSVLFDVHSHHQMGAFLSRTDIANMNELRVYMVLGQVTATVLQVCVAIGIYGHLYHVSAGAIIEGGLDTSCMKSMPDFIDWPELHQVVKVASPDEQMPSLTYPFVDVHDPRWRA